MATHPGPPRNHPASRRKIIVLAVGVLGVVLIAVTVAVWPGSATHPGGDPGGRIMAKIAPVARVIPGFESGHIPWIAFPCDSCQFPVTYAIKIEPRWDSCDGTPGTFGWDPVVIQVGFRWTGSSIALVGLLSKRLRTRGWARGAAPSWGDEGTVTWISPPGRAAVEEFELDPPVLPDGHQRMVLVEAKPLGQLVRGC